MILYVNGDSHTVGHGTGSPHGMTTNDSKYLHINEAPHPDNLSHCYGAIMAGTLACNLVNQARSGGSLARAMRLTKQFVYQTRGPIFVIIGVPSSEREEWYHEGAWYAVHAGGHDTLPSSLHDRYKRWVADWAAGFDYYGKQTNIHADLVQFDQWLNAHCIKHLFFNTEQSFDLDGRFRAHDWQGRFFDPYGGNDHTGAFCKWALQQGFATDHWGHFGKEAHIAWAQVLLNHLDHYHLL